MRRSLPCAAALLLGLAAPVSAGADLTFEHDVRPLLKTYCFECHGEGDKPKGKLDLRLRRLAVRGGKSGPAVVPGKPDDSPLLDRVRKGEMPPGKRQKLPAADVARLARWIAAGARTARPEPVQAGAVPDITPEERAFWAFQPVRRPPVPATQPGDPVRTPIDALLLARLRSQGRSFAPEVDRRTLIRRLTFDLTGLPPTPEAVDAFVADPRPDAYERLVDRLLASPHYGERWGRHWLDAAGYADSDGYTPIDPVRPYAYKYRDYVIRSLNEDKPFDTFVQEQLAGDEMARPPYRDLRPADLDKLVATGFLRMAPDGTGSPGVDQTTAANQVLAETIKIVSTSLLGLTVGCAQCHNHKYDPIPQADYYRLRAVFEPAYDWKDWRPPAARLISLSTDADRRRAAAVERQAAGIDAERTRKLQEYIRRTYERELAKLPAAVRDSVRKAHDTPAARRTPEHKRLLKDYPSVNVTAGSLYLYDHKAAEDLKQIAARAAAVRATKPREDFISPLTEVPGHVPVTHLFHRGDPAQPGPAVRPGPPTVLTSLTAADFPTKDPALPTTGRRLAFARWVTDRANPLTARVLVNRVWAHHFGRGIVGTPGDFGVLGERPTDPELLDWLADEFMARGWRLKALHRLIVTSAAYRQAATGEPRGMHVRRLEAEAVRDAMLAVAGNLTPKLGGPAVPVMEDEVGQFVLGIENKNGENRPGAVIPLRGEEFRRSVYVQVRRSRPLGVLDTFDEPAMEPNCTARTASTVAPQALMLMNNEFVVAQAARFADRLRREAGDDARAQVVRGWRLAFAAEPSPGEVAEALAFLDGQASRFRVYGPTSARRQALACFCQTLLSANQFLYVE